MFIGWSLLLLGIVLWGNVGRIDILLPIFSYDFFFPESQLSPTLFRKHVSSIFSMEASSACIDLTKLKLKKEE
jgi:hypothetical protein